MESQIKAVETELRGRITASRELVAKAKAEGRELTEDEQNELDHDLSALGELKAELKSLKAADADAKAIRADIEQGKKTGWKDIAKSFVKAREMGRRDHVVDTRLLQITGKGIEASDLEDRATLREPGVRALLEDKRALSSLIPSSDPGAALHIEHTSITARGLHSGSTYGVADGESGARSVERDPLSTEAKAEADVTVAVDSVDMRQYAITSGALPNAALRSVPALQGIMEAAMGRELAKALDAAALDALANSGAEDVSAAGGSFMERLAYAKADLVDNGVSGPFIAVISSADAVAFDLIPSADMPRGFPFGLSGISILPSLAAGEGFVMAQNAMHIYKGAARLDADPFTGFESNETNLRMEYEALVVVNESSAIIDLKLES